MNLKSIIFALLFVSSIQHTFAKNNNDVIPSEPLPITRNGSGINGHDGGDGFPIIRSQSTKISPITTVMNEDKNIEVTFLNMGIVTITVKDMRGVTVYARTLNTAHVTKQTIDISKFKAATYTLNFTDSQDKMIKFDKFKVK